MRCVFLDGIAVAGFNVIDVDALHKAIKMPVALIYDVDSLKLNEYAENRAKAMVLQDEAEIEHREADWKKIEFLLKLAYGSLHSTIQ